MSNCHRPVWPHALLRQIPWSIISSKIKYKLCYIEALPMSIMLINNMYIMSYTLCWIYFILQDGWGIFNITGWGRSVAPTGMRRAGPNKLLYPAPRIQNKQRGRKSVFHLSVVLILFLITLVAVIFFIDRFISVYGSSCKYLLLLLCFLFLSLSL